MICLIKSDLPASRAEARRLAAIDRLEAELNQLQCDIFLSDVKLLELSSLHAEDDLQRAQENRKFDLELLGKIDEVRDLLSEQFQGGGGEIDLKKIEKEIAEVRKRLKEKK